MPSHHFTFNDPSKYIPFFFSCRQKSKKIHFSSNSISAGKQIVATCCGLNFDAIGLSQN